MRTKLASVSAVTLALVMSGPGFAQTATEVPTADQAPQAGAAGTTERIDPDAESPEVATEPTLDEDDPALAADPTAEDADADVAEGAAEGLDAPDVAVDPATDTVDGAVTTGDATAGATTDADAMAQDHRGAGFESLHAAVSELDGDAELFFGSFVMAETEDGHKVAMLVGPENFEAGEGDADAVADFPAFRSGLEDAGFAEVNEQHGWTVMQARVDGHTVFAFAGDPQVQAAGMDAEAEGDFDREGFRDTLADAGVESDDTVEAKLFRARTEDGGTVFLLAGPEGFTAGESVELSEDELRERFEEAGFSDVEAVDDDIELVRGEYDGSAVLAMNLEGLRDYDQ